MIWLTWRQFRTQALVGGAGAAGLAALLVVLGLRIRDTYEATTSCGSGCSASAARDTLEHDYLTVLLLAGLLVVLVPALVGAFWGAPLVAREFESGTHRLVWNQSITRGRWLAVKLGLVTAAGVALTAVLSTLLTWAASPYDSLVDGRFDPLVFPTRNLVPLGYAAFAVIAGIVVGQFTRRTVSAMAVTLAVFAVLQILLPTAIRPYLQPAVTETVTYDAASVRQGARINLKGGTARIEGFNKPGAWVLSSSTELLDPSGHPFTGAALASCATGNRSHDDACFAARHAHFVVAYQPADRYWTFQWLEFGGYLLLAAALAGLSFRRISRSLY
ncbi:transporter [Actinocatenispora thailandica]|uniref:Transporter n=1 Tax=Actinocatenispora thailandica TaxID=227318 RepID=A0A7R7DKF8_9ACTN|nr:ABC transporter permease subunit [Actinocatenispora thailandica]BCJ33170.1 transporter [Actinocatenispora thailandica]